jgi:predicted nucleotidyltransferase
MKNTLYVIFTFLVAVSIINSQSKFVEASQPLRPAILNISNLRTGLIAYYSFNNEYCSGRFNDGIVDMSGNNHLGGLLWDTSWVLDRFDNPAYAMGFNGVNNGVVVNRSDDFNYSNDTISVSIWFNISKHVQYGGLICKGSYISNYCISDRMDGKLAVNINHYSQNSEEVLTTKAFPINEWHQLVVIFIPSHIKLYVDGKLDNQITLTKQPMINTEPLYIGVDADGDWEYLNGKLDDLRFYNRILTDDEILQLYNETSEFIKQNSFAGVAHGSAAWGDYDNDGDLDILLTGIASDEFDDAAIYRNNGDNTFTRQTSIPLTEVSEGSAVWGDYNNDGYLDIFLTGWDYHHRKYVAIIYKNNRNNSFTELTSAHLTEVRNSAVAWGDYDNDGDLDILLTGQTVLNSNVSKIYRNNGDDTFTEQTSISLAKVANSSVAWGDYDNDGFLDILLAGTSTSGYVSKLYRNNGDNSFTEQKSISLTGVGNGSAAWGDYDGDGYLDILLKGETGTSSILKIYHNNGDGTFTEKGAISSSISGSAAWGDYDNDGDLDILVNSIIYRNDGSNTFTEQISFSPFNIHGGSVAWGDYDNDSDLDVLLTGYGPDGEDPMDRPTEVAFLYRNKSTKLYTPPVIPSNLRSIVNGNNATLSWNKTSPIGLTYNLAIGTNPGAVDILSPMSDRNTGKRRIVQMGNTGHCNSWTIKGLKPGKYYWSIQVIDNNFAGSKFAEEQVFEVTSSCPSGMISYWKLDETSGNTYKDEEGINDAVAVIPPHPVAGQVYEAQKFNGSNTKLYVAPNSSFDFTKNSSFSIEFWYRGFENPSKYTAAIGRFISNTGARWSVGVDVDGTARFYIISGTGASVHGSVVTDGKWHHIAAAKSATGMKIYIDGALIEGRLRSFGADFSSPTAHLTIGYYNCDPTNVLNGSLDEIAIFNKELTPEEIQQHYSNGLNHLSYFGKGEPPNTSCSPGIVSYWKFDEINGNIYKDEEGLNNAVGSILPNPVAGQVVGAQKFNGKDKKLDVAANPSFDFSRNSSFSVEFWYKGSEVPSNYTAAIGRFISNTGARWSVGVDADGTARFYIISGKGASVHGSVVTDGKWHHIAASKSEGGMKIYVDGVLIEGREREYGADFSSATAPITIGYYKCDPSNVLSGSLDEMAIYSQELTPEEIQQHYNNGLQHLGYCELSALGKQIAQEEINSDLSDNSVIPTEYQLDQNYPNPFNPATTIKYSIPDFSQVTIKVFDILGNEVETLVNEQKPAGFYEVNFNAKHLSSGVYFYRIQAGSFINTKKMILMK